MNSDVYSFALRSAMDEIQNLCPDVIGAFIFKEDGEIVTCSGIASEQTVTRIFDAFGDIFERSNSIGGVDGITINGSHGKAIISRVENFYMAVATSGKADVNYVNTVTRVLISSILKLINKICPAPLNDKTTTTAIVSETVATLQPQESEESFSETVPVEEKTVENVEAATIGTETSASQLIVENLTGLKARFPLRSNFVHVDAETFSRWTEIYGESKIKEVEIETASGKSIRCNVKPIKDTNYAGKGVILIPNKIQLILDVKKGEPVLVKPVIN